MVAANQTYSPFLNESEPIPQNTPITTESNKARTFRRCANACEIVAGTCLNSTIIFTFHLMQVHPVGLFLAMGTAHFYLTATAVGETSRRTTNIMTGASASLAICCSLQEPIGEWLQAHESRSTAIAQINQLYNPQPEVKLPWLEITGIITIITAIILFGKKR